MAKYLVQNSGPLSGTVRISGAKNAVLPLMAAAILADGKCTISEAPELRDVKVMKEILKSLGMEINNIEANVLELDASKLNSSEADYDMVRRMRASFTTMGPLLAKTGSAKVHMPGGCTIGERPIELHLKGFRALGAEIIVKDYSVEAIAPPGGLAGDTAIFRAWVLPRIL